MKRLIFPCITFLLGFFWVSTVAAQTLTLQWDTNSDPAVAGYQVYYQAGSPQPPFLGSEAVQGPSPIDAGPGNSLILDLPDDGKVYYFTVTAYDGSGNESTYSNIVANRPRPMLEEPGLNSHDVGPRVIFSWYHEVTDPNTTYTLVYGPEAEVVAAGLLGGPVRNGWFGWLTAFCSLALLLLFRAKTLRRSWLPMMAAGFFGACLMTACGGGGGDVALGSGQVVSGDVGAGVPGDAISEVPGAGSDPATVIPGVETQVISGIYDQYYIAPDLLPGQTYFWKVLAVDGQGNRVESEIFNFRTASEP